MKLFEFEHEWATAAFDAVFPENTALPHGIVPMNPGRFFADLIAGAPFEQSLGLRLTLWIVAFAPLWVLHTPRTILSISLEERQLVFERLLASRVYAVRQLVAGLKAMISMLYAQSPEGRAAMTAPQPRELESGLVNIRRGRSDEHAHARVIRQGGDHAAE